MNDPTTPSAPDETGTGLPLLRTWQAVYLLVAGATLLWVGLLALLSRVFA